MSLEFSSTQQAQLARQRIIEEHKGVEWPPFTCHVRVDQVHTPASCGGRLAPTPAGSAKSPRTPGPDRLSPAPTLVPHACVVVS